MDEHVVSRDTYHHGDLHDALIDAGMAMARSGGEAAVVLREATRAVGVTPRAAYRHFADRGALVDAVARRALMKMAARIEHHQAAVPDDHPDPLLARLAAVGTGYVEFALDEPGWFEVAFFGLDDMAAASDPAAAGPAGRTPYQQLTDAIDRMVDAGRIDPDQARAIATLCWSSVHGFATLASRGPYRELSRPEADVLALEFLSALLDRLG